LSWFFAGQDKAPVSVLLFQAPALFTLSDLRQAASSKRLPLFE